MQILNIYHLVPKAPRPLLFFCMLLLFTLNGFSQSPTWEHVYNPSSYGSPAGVYSQYERVLPWHGGDAIAVGRHTKPSANFIGGLLVSRFNAQGQEQWTQHIPDLYGNFIFAEPLDSNHIVAYDYHGTMWKIRDDGTLIWQDTIQAATNPITIPYGLLLDNPNRITLGLSVGGAPGTPFKMVVMDSSRNVLLDSTYTGLTSSLIFGSAYPSADGNYFFTGQEIVTSSSSNPFLFKISPSGSVLWTSSIQNWVPRSKPTLLEGPNGNLYLNCRVTDTASNAMRNHMFKLDALGNLLWNGPVADSLDITHMAWGNAGEIKYAGRVMNVNFYQYTEIGTMDTTGTIVSKHRITVAGTDVNKLHSMSMNDRGILIAGRVRPGNMYGGFVSQRDSNGQILLNVVNGRVYHDSIVNCIPDPVESAPPYSIVLAEPDSIYTVTDANGNYELRLDSGDHWISLPSLPPVWNTTCPTNPDSIFTSFAGLTDSLSNANLGIQPYVYCPLLTVDLGAISLRPCMVTQYNLTVSNQGTTPAYQPYVDLVVDSTLNLQSAGPQNYLQTGLDSFRIFFDTLNPFSSSTCVLSFMVDCNTSLVGLTPCIDAEVFPNESCFPASPNWDSSSVDVSGACIPGDSILFTVSNVGSHDMSVPTGIIIAEDDILRYSHTAQLAAGTDTTFVIAGNGSTWSLVADQVPDHPGTSLPRATVEACGTDSFGNFSTGHVLTLQQDDQDLFRSIECISITAPYDPNDKRGVPFGTGPEHFIETSDIIDYKIRFQNTGNDTAFNVVVRDQLPPELNLASLQLGTSSFPYSFSILSDNTLEWTFTNIQLPDSNVNEPASHGYLKFRIAQRPNNAPGTVIKNAASIYFDFNEAIITDTSLHTIADPEVGVVILNTAQALTGPAVQAFPNPFSKAVTFKFMEKGDLRVELYNLHGQLQRVSQVNDANKLILERGKFPAGLFVYRSFLNGQLVQTGKLISY